MRIVFVLTYPVHYIAEPAQWLGWANRDRRMPGLLGEMGVDAELWGVGPYDATYQSELDGIGPHGVRLFAVSDPRRPARAQTSLGLLDAARTDPADLFVLIGTNGPAGHLLHDRVLLPERRRYAVIIGGDYWSRTIPGAALVLPETAAQRRALERPFPRVWRRPVARDRLVLLPKAIDTDRFHPPIAPVSPRWDIVATSRLVRWKRFDEVGALSRRYRVAVIGDGPDGPHLRARWPAIDWLGHQPNAQVPSLLAQARLFFHAGGRDWFPRAIVEAMACGLPVAALSGRIGTDVVPPTCGILVPRTDALRPVERLLADPAHLSAMGTAARLHAVATHGARSSEPACRRLMEVAG